MATLVTGATGFLGSHIARKLAQRGERVRILLRKTSKTANVEDIDAERVYGDILDIGSVKEALRGCDTLYHTAGLVSSKKKDHKLMEEINIKGTVNVLSMALKAGIKKVVYTSSVAAIGVDPDGGLANEETPFNLGHLGVSYINTKYYAEKEAMKLYHEGLPLVIVNPSVAIGPGDIYLVSNGLIVWHFKGAFPGYVDGGLNLVDVCDVAEGHILAAERGRLGERYILGNANLTIRECFDLLERVTGLPVPKWKVPYFMALAMGFVSERLLRISTPSFIAHDVDSARASRLYWYFDSSKAVRDLGYHQAPLETTVEKTLRWLKDFGYLDD
jgi:dihydroflavonol-4-reductase